MVTKGHAYLNLIFLDTRDLLLPPNIKGLKIPIPNCILGLYVQEWVKSYFLKKYAGWSSSFCYLVFMND